MEKQKQEIQQLHSTLTDKDKQVTLALPSHYDRTNNLFSDRLA